MEILLHKEKTMLRKLIAISIVAITFAACGGADKKGSDTTIPVIPKLTFNGTTTVNAGEAGEVSIPSNTQFTIEAPDSTSWSYGSSGLVKAYVSETGGTRYTAKVYAEQAVQYIIKVTFSGDKVATLTINVTSGGTCEGVTCSNHGSCGNNAADFPVCTCTDPYYAYGFDCSFAGSCKATDDSACIDYIGPLWNASSSCAEGFASSSDPCVMPTPASPVGSCNAKAESGAEYVVYYYSPGFTVEQAVAACAEPPPGTWTPADG